MAVKKTTHKQVTQTNSCANVIKTIISELVMSLYLLQHLGIHQAQLGMRCTDLPQQHKGKLLRILGDFFLKIRRNKEINKINL